MTRDRVAFKYGRIEASIKLPSGQGLWPAFWMLPQDDTPEAIPGAGIYGDYAQSGEIDIVEAINLDANPTPAGRGGGNEIFSTIHFGGQAALGQNLSAETLYTPSFDVTEEFHTYAFEWDEFEMRWYADGTLYKVENSWSSAGGAYPAPFDQPFYMLFNLAVGGDFPGSPDGTTPSPATMEVDWVRVYSGEAPPVVPADPGIIPDVTLYDRDGDPDLVFGVDYADILTFGSGAALDGNDVSDADFSPAFSVTTGFGYDKWNAQLAYVGFAAGFATDYESLDFKAKGLSGDLIRVKFLDGGAYIDINLTSSGYSTALGNDWYQVSVPIADFSGVDTALGLLFETIEPAPAESFTYLLTDIGFSGTAGGGGTNLGVFSETNIETVVNITNIVSGGNPVTIDTASTAVTPFEGAVSLQLVYSDNAANNNYGGAIFEFGDEDLSAYDTLKFSIDTSAFTNFANLTVQLEPPGGGTPGGNVGLAGYTPVATAGNWNTYEIPLTDFTALNPSLVNKLGFFNARDAGDVLLAGTLYLDDIHFTTVGGGGPGGPVGDGTFVNGDFEAGDFTGWTQTPDGGSITLDSSEQGGRAGTVARLVATGAASGAQDVLLSQVDLVEINSVSLSGGDSVTVSVDVFGSLTGAGGVVFIELISRAANGSETGRNFIGPAPITPTAMWTTQSSTVNVAADVSGGITLQLKSSCGAVDGCGVDASFDNVSMVIN
jgi:hypothetical protein